MPRNVRFRFWLETISAGLFGVSSVVTLVSPDWIEHVLRFEPDQGNGWLLRGPHGDGANGMATLSPASAGTRPLDTTAEGEL